MKIEYVNPNDIKPYKRNARKHGEEDIEAIKASIEKVGFRDPIGVWKNTIVEGHGRQIAALELGLDRVPIIRLDDMTDEERRTYALAHNRTAELSDWEDDILKSELKALHKLQAEATQETDTARKAVSELRRAKQRLVKKCAPQLRQGASTKKW